jgi:hypothetical protein
MVVVLVMDMVVMAGAEVVAEVVVAAEKDLGSQSKRCREEEDNYKIGGGGIDRSIDACSCLKLFRVWLGCGSVAVIYIV